MADTVKCKTCNGSGEVRYEKPGAASNNYLNGFPGACMLTADAQCAQYIIPCPGCRPEEHEKSTEGIGRVGNLEKILPAKEAVQRIEELHG